MADVKELSERVAGRLGAIPGVAAVTLGGSWGRGTARPDSDVDLGVYYHAGQFPPLDELRALAADLDPAGAKTLTGKGGWGPWINGGAWLMIEGVRLDWIYRDLDQVARVIDECVEGTSRLYHQPGHPHGFHTHIYLGEIHHARALHDPSGKIASLKRLVATYPPALKKTLAETFLWQSGFALETSRKSARRGDTFHVAGSLFQCAAAMVQVVFALNGQYFTNEKGAIDLIRTMPVQPVRFPEAIEAVLAGPGGMPAHHEASLAEFEKVLSELKALVATAAANPPSPS